MVYVFVKRKNIIRSIRSNNFFTPDILHLFGSTFKLLLIREKDFNTVEC